MTCSSIASTNAMGIYWKSLVLQKCHTWGQTGCTDVTKVSHVDSPTSYMDSLDWVARGESCEEAGWGGILLDVPCAWLVGGLNTQKVCVQGMDCGSCLLPNAGNLHGGYPQRCWTGALTGEERSSWAF
jgi:hypothetical protein